MKVDGSCHCGATTLEAEIDPETVTICHCSDCQKLSATAFRVAVPAAAETVRFSGPTPKIYVKVGESGNARAQAFCDTCGSQFYSSDTGEHPRFYMLRVGILDQRAELSPKAEIWTRSRLPWLTGMAPESRQRETG